jgi:hypothetical protein
LNRFIRIDIRLLDFMGAFYPTRLSGLDRIGIEAQPTAVGVQIYLAPGNPEDKETSAAETAYSDPSALRTMAVSPCRGFPL